MVRRLPLIISIVCVLLSSCRQQVPVTLSVLFEGNLPIAEEGGIAKLHIFASRPWKASCDCDWCILDRYSGAMSSEKGEEVVVNFERNKGYGIRTGSITINCEDLTEIIDISQKPKSYLSIEPTVCEVSCESNQIEVEVSTTDEFSVIVDESKNKWIHILEAKMIDTHRLVISIDANDSYDIREGEVLFVISNGFESEVLTIIQLPKGELKVSPQQISINQNAQLFDINIKTNVSFDVHISEDVDWLTYLPFISTKTLGDSTLYFQSSENTTNSDREAKIAIVQTEGRLSDTVSVKQLKTSASLSVKIGAKMPFLADGATTILHIVANRPWIITSDCDWCNIDMNSGEMTPSEGVDVELVCDGNPSHDIRSGTISISCDGLTKTILVSQEAKGFFSIEPKYCEVNEDSNELEIIVNTTDSYNIVVDENSKSWIKHIETKSIEKNNVIISVEANDNFEQRIGKLFFITQDNQFSEELTIVQAPKKSLQVIPKQVSLGKEEQDFHAVIKSNVDYNVHIPQQVDWINYVSVISSKSLSESTSLFHINSNEDYFERVAKIAIVQRNGNLTDTLTVRQQPTNIISTALSYFDVTEMQQQIYVDVFANVDYEIVSDCEWIRYCVDESSFPTKLAFTIDRNVSMTGRSGSILLCQKDGDIKEVISVHQAQQDQLTVLDKFLEVGRDEQVAHIKILTNVDYQVIIPEDVGWIRVSETRRDENNYSADILIEIDANGFLFDREGTISIVASKCRDIIETVSIHQSYYNKDSDYIFIFGDIQYYTNSTYINLYQQSLDWVQHQYEVGMRVGCILHTGDICHNGNSLSHWSCFKDSMVGIAQKIPYYSMIGDHDYTWFDGIHIDGRYGTMFNDYLQFPLSMKNVEAQFEAGRMENVVIKNYINGERIDFLILEFGPRKEVVDWANDYVKSHPHHKYILMTHEYLEKGGGRRVMGLKMAARLQNTSYTTPNQLWESLITCNNNIICVLCGHVGGLYAVTVDINDFGRQVPQIQHNIQGSSYRHDNWLMMWEFPAVSDSVNVSIINTRTGHYYNNQASLCKFNYRH